MNKTQVAVIATIDRVAAAIEEAFRVSLRQRLNADEQVVAPSEWTIHKFVVWESGVSLVTSEALGIYVHTSQRQLLADPATGKLRAGGPDVNVGFVLRCHRDRIEAGARLGAHIAEALWDVAITEGFDPHFHNFTTFGQANSTDWGVGGTILFGPVDGAPGEGW